MGNTVIKVDNISKFYQLGLIGSGTINRDFQRWWKMKMKGEEDPFMKIGETNERSVKGESDIVWSLKDVSFEIGQGEAWGIVGRNGAGKSTLLKILSRVTAPSSGRINVKGRVASLLEVGTGFHPELTGRENIFLNGAILGMRKKEIASKLDEIIDFSGVERYIDTPVKRYSSGMYVRLAFGVAAHLESEILIIDEVLAVGDAEFQKKCLGKMGEVSRGDGRTVLFVSHNMGAIKQLCQKSIFLKTGMVEQISDTNTVVRNYLQNSTSIRSEKDQLNDSKTRRGNGEIRFVDIKVNGGDLYADPEKEITIDFKAKVLKTAPSAYFSMIIRGPENSEPITNTGMLCITDKPVLEGNILSFRISIPANTFRTGLFPLYFWIGKPKDFIGDHYPYDVVDSLYYLNLSSDKSEIELGYNSANPVGYFNFNKQLLNIKLEANA